MPPVRSTKKNNSAANYGELRASNPKTSSLSAWVIREPRNLPKNVDASESSSKNERERSASLAPAPLREATVEKEAPKPKVAKGEPKPKVVKGEPTASFEFDGAWKEHASLIGTSTKRISFGTHFVLTDTHLDDIVALGPRITNKLTGIEFKYANVDYNAHNDAHSLTDDALAKIANACPKLKKVELPGTSGLTDDSLSAFLSACPDLTHLEITAASKCSAKFTVAPLESLLENPDMAPKLRKLRLEENTKRPFMKAVRDLTSERESLAVELVSVTEEKEYGDWEMKIAVKTYKKGRKAKNGKNSGDTVDAQIRDAGRAFGARWRRF